MDTTSAVIPARRVARISAARRVSRAWYWLALAILAAGVLLPAVWGVTSVDSALEKADAFPRATVPGAVTVTVTEPGDQIDLLHRGRETRARRRWACRSQTRRAPPCPSRRTTSS